ncbi:MAG TPA: PIG-L family deacetylase [Candidatus Dormibacteraeota bacterium]|nr:PIG-L family deacetylase [Candidatus Dormibacteraeota bacterium]
MNRSPSPGGGSLRLGPVDVLIFAPHPDDEVIGTAGVIQQALESGRRVRVVFATNGDGSSKAASQLFRRAATSLREGDYVRLARRRQQEAIAADGKLGLGNSDLVFLGYPDAALAAVYANRGNEPIRSPTTGRTTTYGPFKTDHHTLARGRPAAYTHEAALADFGDVLRDSRPAQVYVTDPADLHHDHVATYNFVHEAMVAASLDETLMTFLVHSGPGWPRPAGPTPDSPFESFSVDGTVYPIGVTWPPPIRVPLDPGQSARKLAALDTVFSKIASRKDRLYLESFVKSEEVFWARR